MILHCGRCLADDLWENEKISLQIILFLIIFDVTCTNRNNRVIVWEKLMVILQQMALILVVTDLSRKLGPEIF